MSATNQNKKQSAEGATTRPLEFEASYQLGSAIYIIESLTGIDSKTLKPLMPSKNDKLHKVMLRFRKKNAKINAIKFLEEYRKVRA